MKFGEAVAKKPKKKAPPPPAVIQYDLGPAKAKVAEYLAQLEEFEKLALKFIVSDDTTSKAIVELGTRSAKLIKALDADRKERIAVEDNYVRSTNKLYKPLTDVGKRIKKVCSDKFQQYQARVRMEQQKREKAAAEAHRKLQAKMDKEAAKANVEPVEVAPVEIPVAEKVTRTETGTGHIRKYWTWKEVDFSKVPNDYKLLDEVLINKQVKAGIREIPGLEIYQKEQTQFRT